jgi:hypothetical protein
LANKVPPVHSLYFFFSPNYVVIDSLSLDLIKAGCFSCMWHRLALCGVLGKIIIEIGGQTATETDLSRGLGRVACRCCAAEEAK